MFPLVPFFSEQSINQQQNNMKRTRILAASFLGLAMVFAFSACEKDNSGGDGGGGVIGGGGSGKQLARLTTVSYYENYANYTLSYTEGYYHYTTLYYTNGYWTGTRWAEFVSDGDVEEGDSDFRIDNNGHITGYTEDGQTIAMDVTYDNNGHMTRVYYPWESGDGWDLDTYTWENGVITRHTSESSEYSEPRVTTYEWQDGNLTSKTIVRSDYRETTTYLYDNHPSYMSGMREDIVMIMEGIEELSKNNRIKETKTTVYNSDGSTYTDTYSYIYNYGSDGYPTNFKRIYNHEYSSGYYYKGERTTYIQYSDGSGAAAPTVYYIGTGNTNGFDSYCLHGKGWYAQNALVMLHADSYYSNGSYHFDHWQDGNTSNPRSLTCTGNATYTATYVQD